MGFLRAPQYQEHHESYWLVTDQLFTDHVPTPQPARTPRRRRAYQENENYKEESDPPSLKLRRAGPPSSGRGGITAGRQVTSEKFSCVPALKLARCPRSLAASLAA